MVAKAAFWSLLATSVASESSLAMPLPFYVDAKHNQPASKIFKNHQSELEKLCFIFNVK